MHPAAVLRICGRKIADLFAVHVGIGSDRQIAILVDGDMVAATAVVIAEEGVGVVISVEFDRDAIAANACVAQADPRSPQAVGTGSKHESDSVSRFRPACIRKTELELGVESGIVPSVTGVVLYAAPLWLRAAGVNRSTVPSLVEAVAALPTRVSPAVFANPVKVKLPVAVDPPPVPDCVTVNVCAPTPPAPLTVMWPVRELVLVLACTV